MKTISVKKYTRMNKVVNNKKIFNWNIEMQSFIFMSDAQQKTKRIKEYAFMSVYFPGNITLCNLECLSRSTN